jgi:hypothetical protein
MLTHFRRFVKLPAMLRPLPLLLLCRQNRSLRRGISSLNN